MPCDTVQRSSVNLELKADNKQYLIAALKKLGYAVQEIGDTIHFTTRDGVRGVYTPGRPLNVSSYGRAAESFNVNPIKQAYSAEVVKGSARKWGWKLEQTGEFEFKVQKQSF